MKYEKQNREQLANLVSGLKGLNCTKKKPPVISGVIKGLCVTDQ